MPQVSQQRPNRTPTSKSSVLERIRRISFEEDEGIKCVLYGRSGTGKTTLWATFPGPILAVICSGGNKPGELRSINTEEYRQKVHTVTLEHSGELVTLADHARQAGYATMVLDHGSGLQDMVLKEILGLDILPAQKSWGMASQQLYGQCTGTVKDLFRYMLNLDGNVVIVAQERNFNDDAESDLILPSVGAGLTPSLTNWLNTAADYVAQTFIRQKEVIKRTTVGTGKQAKQIETKVKVKGKVEYCLRTAPDPTYMTKFRVPKGTPLPEALVDPSYDKIMALIRGEG